MTILARPQKKQPEPKPVIERDIGSSLVRAIREAGFFTYSALGLFLLIALLTFSTEDPGWTHTGIGKTIANGGGAVGAWLSDMLLSLFGVMAFVFPFLLGANGYAVFKAAPAREAFQPLHGLLRWSGLLLAMISGAGLTHLYLAQLPIDLPESGGGYGGIVGNEIVNLSSFAFGTTGATVLLTAACLAGVSLFTGLSWLGLVDQIGKAALLIGQGFGTVLAGLARPSTAPADDPVAERESAAREAAAPSRGKKPTTPAVSVTAARKPPAAEAAAAPFPQAPPKPLPPQRLAAAASPGALPPLELLNAHAPQVKGYSRAALDEMSRQLEAILGDFGVEAEVVEVHPGPVITRFELQPAAGVKVSRITGLAKDLARALSVTSVRVVEVIPGKSVVGLEIPNQEREIVLLHSVISSSQYRDNASPLTLVLGKDIGGQPVVANLGKMPHLLVAGTTGSGKSVAINVMILSILYKARPEDVRLIMIDPKMLELSIYEGIPHLLTPVVTDMKEAANALRWCVAEMERRYKLMSLVGVRNLAGFNQKVADASAAGAGLRDPLWKPGLDEDAEAPVLMPLPTIVIVIDELADLMMIVGKKVEELIARLAQKARAAGLHLILATQRPSVDVITGLIKANIPTRLSFQVSSRIDSRTIIDQGGAEALLGNGDMLYLPPGTGFPLRAHGAFVSDQEVHAIVDFLKASGQPQYLEDITRFSEDSVDFGGGRTGGSESGDELDPLYDEAVRFVTESRKASISSVQRRFKVGYNRAARMVEDMESAGIVGPAETNGSREVLAPPPPEA
ncbi:DNA translocase FtsK [Methylolobus aquaticus]